ncbi:MAG: site-specific integrase [Acidobacteria bacterium]|nr:site-specific integrase [Acidobacteriota bacterium]
MAVDKRKCERCKGKCKHGRTWYYSFCIRGVRYKRAVPEAQTKYDALQAESKAKEAIFTGRYGSEPSNITLREFVEKEFLPWSKDNKRSWRNDVSRSKPILDYFKNKKMREITKLNVEQFKKTRLTNVNKRGKLRAPASVDLELALLSRIFTLAIERELMQSNPCKSVKKLRVMNLVERYLTADEESRLRTLLQESYPQLFDIFLIALHTGMRKMEICTLHKSQIDFQRESIHLKQTKSGKPRSVPIHPDIRPMLQRLTVGVGKNGYLFENPKTGKAVVDFKKAWYSALRDAKITGFRFHDIRHTFGTRAIDAGAPVSAVKEVMGHTDISTTMRYVHATEEGKRKAVEAAANWGKGKSSVPNLHHSPD